MAYEKIKFLSLQSLLFAHSELEKALEGRPLSIDNDRVVNFLDRVIEQFTYKTEKSFSLFEVAAFYIFSSVHDQPLGFANDRIALFIGLLFLEQNNIKIELTEVEIIEFLDKIKKNEMEVPEIINFFQTKIDAVLAIEEINELYETVLENLAK